MHASFFANKGQQPVIEFAAGDEVLRKRSSIVTNTIAIFACMLHCL